MNPIHLHPRTAAIADRNTQAIADATAAPPDNLPDTPHAYLAWLRNPGQKPARPTAPPSRRTFLPNTPRRPIKERDPAYAPAAAELARLPDLGAALIEQARTDLEDPTWEALVIHAAHLINGHKAQ